jgi:hypothetical protein
VSDPLEEPGHRSEDGDGLSARSVPNEAHSAGDCSNEPQPAEFVRRVPGFVIPAHAFASGWLDQIGGVGPRVIPLDVALPVKGAIADGEAVFCWINGEPIVVGQLHFDHVIPYSFGGATNAENLLPSNGSANMSRGNSLEILRDRKIGWKWDEHDPRVRVPDRSQRLVRVVTPEAEAVYWSVPKFQLGELAAGAAAAAGLALAIEGALQWRTGEFRPDDLGEQGAKALAGYCARYTAKIGVRTLGPRAIALGANAAGVRLLSTLAGPIGLIAATYGAEAVAQCIALARGKVSLREAAKEFALAPVGAVKDTVEVAVAAARLLARQHRALRETHRKWRSANFLTAGERAEPSRPTSAEDADNGQLPPAAAPTLRLAAAQESAEAPCRRERRLYAGYVAAATIAFRIAWK